MSKGHILSEYGPERKESRGTSCGGVEKAKELRYDPPKGPKGQMNNSVGLGGTNHGCCGTQGKH